MTQRGVGVKIKCEQEDFYMRKRLSAAIVMVVLLLPVSEAFAVAEAGVPSLIIPPGARPNGMGETFVAIADDATAA